MPDARVEIPSVMGDVLATVSAAVNARVEAASIMGDMLVLGRIAPVDARVQIDHVMGDILAQAGQPRDAQVQIDSVMGYVRGYALNKSDLWDAYGLPCVRAADYETGNNPGLVRTTFDSGVTRQRRYSTETNKPARVSVRLTEAQLVTMENLLDEVGAGWFGMTIQTGSTAELHTVKIVDKPETHNVKGALYEARLQLAIQ